jgi:hypothetical protein
MFSFVSYVSVVSVPWRGFMEAINMSWFSKKPTPQPTPAAQLPRPVWRRKIADMVCQEVATDHLRVFRLVYSGALDAAALKILAETWYWRALCQVTSHEAEKGSWQRSLGDLQVWRVQQYFDASPRDSRDADLFAIGAARTAAWVALTTGGPDALVAEETRQLQEFLDLLDLVEGSS